MKKRSFVARASSKGPDEKNSGGGFNCPASNVFEEEVMHFVDFIWYLLCRRWMVLLI